MQSSNDTGVATDAQPEPSVFKPQELLARVESFVEGAAELEPCNMSSCPRCFRVLVREIVRCDMSLRHLRKYYPDFFEACLILIIEFADADIPRLRERLSANQLQCADRTKLHKIKFTAPFSSDPLDMFLEALYIMVTGGLTHGKNPIFNANPQLNKKHFTARKGYWPSNLDELFPLGIEKCLDALIFWCCVPFSEDPFQLLNKFIFIARPLVMEPLLGSPRRERLAWAQLQAMTPSTRVAWPLGREPPFQIPRGLSVPRSLRGSAVAVTTALVQLYALSTDTDARSTDAARFVAGLEHEFMQTLMPLPEQLPETAALQLRTVNKYVCMMLPDHGRDTCGLTLPNKVSVISDYFIRCADDRRCARPGCENSELAVEGEDGPRRFKQCGRCKTVRYCSRACQRAHWRHEAPPHRDVCPVICELISLGVPLGAKYEDFGIVYTTCRMRGEKEEILYQAALGSKLLHVDRHLLAVA
ncbi:hypothetical protein AURDEDRAFT_129636 [Auricularia subglabra TFB-10046 SS5]|nr:hypothetical protein AURDEDRAFT_129636 [Auricularia subglabra TFB-10046 SS5]